ncbi:hypothetical protein J2736_002211 [Paenibacillus qinlingensis]|uniref:Uncharacterized protein n=1 Tax=Paenibacillus qinlingensis TaxID=1837343 RepID=A0ABU1NU81_9BACL|nr:hypothetical protein [Paenibacillus qinlingensis]
MNQLVYKTLKSLKEHIEKSPIMTRNNVNPNHTKMLKPTCYNHL